jgi:hypothetical protein
VSTHLLRQKSPEEVEIEAKRAELAAQEARFGEQELALATAQAELRSFEHRYVQALGALFAELDRLEADAAKLEASLHPRDAGKQSKASHAEARAQESAQAARDAQAPGPAPDFTPSEDLKNLYRKAAMRIHPDLAANPDDRPRRERIMAQVNAAYEAGDEDRLCQILREWESSPDGVTGDGPGADLIRLIRKIARVNERLAAMANELTALRATELAQLKVKVDEAAAKGQDLLADMAKDLNRQIREMKSRLSNLRSSSTGRKA